MTFLQNYDSGQDSLLTGHLEKIHHWKYRASIQRNHGIATHRILIGPKWLAIRRVNFLLEAMHLQMQGLPS